MRLLLVIIISFVFLLTQGCKDPDPPGPGTLDGTWTQLSDPTFPVRENAVSFVLNNKAYIGCGKDGITYLNDFYSYDGTAWSPAASLPANGRSGAVAFVMNGKAYVGLGQSENTAGQQNVYQDFWEYDPTSNSWSAAPIFPGQPRYHASAFIAGGNGFVSAGINSNANRLEDVWRLDNNSNNWIQMMDFPDGVRIKTLGTSILDNGFLFGGTDNNDIWEYNHSLDTWTKRLDMEDLEIPSRDGSILFTIGSDSYYGMGSGSGNYYTDLWKFDFHAYILTEQKEFEGTGRKNGISFSLNNKGYVLMGGNNSNLHTDFWEFTP